ncbi:DUF6314 family protein [Streptomyces sulfonofaciens]|uniref:DUF6314 family protein n=1 Tax=Streptomyces sulfonofaciens TaxID=68272 RepID=UPI0035711C61
MPDTLAYLTGAWHVERTVRDAASGAEGRFTGTTVFTPLLAEGTGGPGAPGSGAPGGHDGHGGPGERGGGLLSRESGTFVWQGTARPATRVLRFLPGERPGTARVEFSDGRPFHDLDLGAGHHVAHHPCAADVYRGEFTVTGPDRWRSVWWVAGPAKDQLLVTDYTRLSEPPGTP